MREVPLNAVFYGDLKLGFPGGASGKEPTCQCRRLKRRGFHPSPWVGKIPWRREWQPTPVFLPGQSQGQRSLAGCSPWGGTESNTTDVTWHMWGLESIHIEQGVRNSHLGGGCEDPPPRSNKCDSHPVIKANPRPHILFIYMVCRMYLQRERLLTEAQSRFATLKRKRLVIPHYYHLPSGVQSCQCQTFLLACLNEDPIKVHRLGIEPSL